MLQKIFISLGTNEGDRLQNLQKAIDVLYTDVGNTTAISAVYETASWGFESANFLNCCIELTTNLSPEKLLNKLQEIELQLGRKEKTKTTYQARVIDIDILFYGNEIVETPALSIPHVQLEKRVFVLQPLVDIAPTLIHPKLNKTVTELVNSCNDDCKISEISESLHNPFDVHVFSNYNFITIEGNIGSGKTSLTSMIAEDFQAKCILESFSENVFLPRFYEDQTRFAFPLEMNFLADRYKQLTDEISQYDLFKEFVVSDYHISKSLTFAKVTLQEDEFVLYKKFFNVIYKDMQQPDVYVYLYQNTERLLQNIEKRGREYEQNIQSDYLEKINKGYMEFIQAQANLNVKKINVSALDFVNNRADYLKLLKQILD